MSTRLADLHVAIVGLGLMGASLGYDLRGHCRRVTGIVRRPEAVAEAISAGCVDDATTDAASAVSEADLVVLATPVLTILRQIAEYGPMLKPGAILLDMGSTKVEICRAMETLPEHVQVIGGHPMCGKEVAGLAAAEAGLYRDCTFVLSPLPRTSELTQAIALELVEFIGARSLALDPARHDRLAATISHLPYMAAIAQVMHVDKMASEFDPLVWDMAASGFRDSTRVAASDVHMLMDILITNRAEVLSAIEHLQGHLQSLYELLGDVEAEPEDLRDVLDTMAQRRREWERVRRLSED
ncbi:MAG: prephenate dehydrogenase [Caldilineales bacterium]|nr:prephenate dehydrogenase [Caldilineales bacterium]